MSLPEKRNPILLSDRIQEYWDPHLLAELNGQHVRLAKLKGEFVWHSHENEDEMFFVLKGCLEIKFRVGSVELNAGEMLVVPRGMEHKPIAREEVLVILFEPGETVNTGDAGGTYTRREIKSL